MNNYDDVHAVLRDLGFADDAKPHGTTYVNPRHVIADPEPEIADEEPERDGTAPRKPFEALTGGSGSPLATDPSPTAAEIADRIWANQRY